MPALVAKSVQPCKPDFAHRHTGYQVGGSSPFGRRKSLRVFVEATILEVPEVLINDGRRGYPVGMAPAVMFDVLGAHPVHCALSARQTHPAPAAAG